ncbi:MAG: hypothetical protein JJU37_01345 [Balneolaceae bacterium]|nr:hypothetical protein [Balneolaceae bacterium]
MMKSILIKAGIITLVVLFYFTVWSEIRGMVTAYAFIPQIEYVIENCNEYVYYTERKPTSLLIQVYHEGINDYVDFSYTTPAGFYLLMGLVILIMFNGKKFHYYLLAGLHLILWVISLSVLIPGLCVHLLFMNIMDISIKYFTPFGTFIIIIMVLTPGFLNKLSVHSKKDNS